MAFSLVAERDRKVMQKTDMHVCDMDALQQGKITPKKVQWTCSFLCIYRLSFRKEQKLKDSRKSEERTHLLCWVRLWSL